MTAPRWTTVGAEFDRLASLSVEEQARELEQLRGRSPELAAEVASLLEADRSGVLPEDPVPAPLDALQPGAVVAAYRILGELGRGGMGVVYHATRDDGAFDREVAIKVMRPDMVSPGLTTRFLTERRVLGQLDHPAIPRLLDAGTTTQGQLFVVLELVEGQALDAWSVGRPLHEKLALFEQVCDAVAHAHQRLVLHRDIKPSNVLVAAGNSPKLLDFGIARLLDPEAGSGAATQLGVRALTPDYASPQQLRGEPLSTAYDVWALGVVLYELLTGELPHPSSPRRSLEERARRIEVAPAPRPSAELRRKGAVAEARAVEGNLDAIVSRALAPEPGARYPSVAALAADLRRHREGHPIEARIPSLTERARLFVRRNRLAVGVATGVAAILLVATTVSVRQAAIAKAALTRAEHRFDQLRRLAGVFLFELPGRIEALPGSTGARELLVETGLEYLDPLAAEAGDDMTLLAEVAAGYERMGQIQGGFEAPNVGETSAALATFDHAIELRSRLAQADGRAEARISLAQTHLLRATARLKTGLLPDALADAAVALELIAAAGVESREQRALHARAVFVRGQLEAASGDVTVAEGSYRAALAELDALLAETEEQELRRTRTQVLARLGSALGQDPARLGEVDLLWAEALAADRALVAAEPHHAIWRRALVASLARLSILRGVLGRYEEALELSAEAVALARRIAEDDPDDTEAVRTLVNVLLRRSVDLADVGRAEEAEAAAREGLERVRGLHQRDPGNAELEASVADGHLAVAQSVLRSAYGGRNRELWRSVRTELAAAAGITAGLLERGAITESASQARDLPMVHRWIEECDRILAGRPATLGPDGQPLR